MQFRVINKQTPYQGFFKLSTYTLRHERFDGGWSGDIKREILERGHAVAVLIHDPATDNILLIEQFRPGAMDDQEGPWMLEIVAGIIETGETATDVAKREAQEEAGCTISEVKPILDCYPSSGGSSETISICYAAMDLSTVEPGIHGLAAENEDIRTLLVPLNDAMDWIRQGKIKSAMTIIALQWLLLEKTKAQATKQNAV